MPNPFSLISAYPDKELMHKIIVDKKVNKLNVYVDLKNVMVSMFVESIVTEIVSNSKTMKNIDTSIFQSTLAYTIWWKKFIKYFPQIESFNIYYCSDKGVSTYHNQISENYKESHSISKYDTLVHSREIKEIRDRNFHFCENIVNRFPEIHFFYLSNLESDFLPYYLITRFDKSDMDTMNIICSGDKDCYQCVVDDNCYMIYTKRGVKYMVDRDNLMYNFCKVDKRSDKFKKSKTGLVNELNPDYIPVLLSILGDAPDDIAGIPNVGISRALDAFKHKDLVNILIGSTEDICNRVLEEGTHLIKDVNHNYKINNIWNKLIEHNEQLTNSFKLISFECLCKWLEQKDTGNKLKMINYIGNIYRKVDTKIIDENSINDFIKFTEKFEDFQIDNHDLYHLV